MLNKKKIAELEKEIAWHKEVAKSRQDRLTNITIENQKLTAEVAALNDNIKLLEDVEPEQIKADPLNWICGEPKKLGWYFVAYESKPENDIVTKSGQLALFYNPAARCRWMRGEKGNAERFEQEVIAYIEAPEYEEGV